MLSLGPNLPLSFRLWLAPACLPASGGDGPVCSQLDLLWYSLIPLFYEQAQLCLRLGLFVGNFSVSLSFSSLSLAIPQFGLLSHVSSLRLLSGHSGLVLNLSNAAHASLFSPHLLVADASVWATSPPRLGGVWATTPIMELPLGM